MLFNSYIFVFIFLPLAVTGYYWLHKIGKPKTALCFLLIMSMWFYGYNSVEYLFMLSVSIILNYAVVQRMRKTSGLGRRRIMLMAGLAVNIGILFYFKYYDFFAENVNLAFKTDFKPLGLMLPLGISFYTFQQLSYVIDSYRNECENYSFLEYASYVSFFPQLIAGPIVYHNELIPALKDKANHRPNYENLSRGIYAFALGLAKKALIADTFSKAVAAGYGNIGDLNTVSVITVMICYSMQIYFDFSGYCDMAYGIGYMFNVRLPVNFNSPYKAASISEFWDRWHMTLTRFFTKYVYIPLGGSRRGKARTYINVMIVFLVSGIWHGANWTFILWGIINGIGNVFDKAFGKFFRWVPRAVGVALTFCFSTMAWSLFRADSVSDALRLWRHLGERGDNMLYAPITDAFNDLIEVKMLCRIGFGGLVERLPYAPLLLFMTVAVLSCFLLKNTQEKTAGMRFNGREIITVIVLVMWSILSMSDVSEFLYFNF